MSVNKQDKYKIETLLTIIALYTELCIFIIFVLLVAAAAESPRSSHAISVNHFKLSSSYEQYEIVKQVVDNNAFSNLSRNLSPPVTSNLAPGNSGGGNNSTGLTNLAPGNSGGGNNSTGLTNLAPGNSGGGNNSTGLTNLAPGKTSATP